MRIAILGATRGIGRALAREASQAGHALALLGRDDLELERSTQDLRARTAGCTALWAHCDLAATASFPQVLEDVATRLGGLDAVVLTAALFAPQDVLTSDTARLEQLLHANFTGSILFLEAARKKLLALGGGTLCALSSVAGDRARKPIFLYGATKAGLSHYLEGVDHAFHSKGLRVVCVKPGFVRTGMTSGLKPPPFAGEPGPVARDILRALERGTPVLYTPAMWRWVMLIIRNLPRAVMRRLGF